MAKKAASSPLVAKPSRSNAPDSAQSRIPASSRRSARASAGITRSVRSYTFSNPRRRAMDSAPDRQRYSSAAFDGCQSHQPDPPPDPSPDPPRISRAETGPPSSTRRRTVAASASRAARSEAGQRDRIRAASRANLSRHIG